MAALPLNATQSPTVAAIYERYRRTGGTPSRRLGAGQIGKECERELWFNFRWASESSFDGRMLRLFETGQLEEERVIRDLRNIGLEVFDKDPFSKKQFGFNDLGNHFAGFIDGVVLGVIEAPVTPHLLEVKTYNAKRFATLKSTGVKTSSPEHYAQMIVYMHYLDLTRAFYLAVCKDTDELYAERIHADEGLALALIAKADRIITSLQPPFPMSKDPAFFKCKFCNHHAVCHFDQPMQKNCRTCRHLEPIEDGWRCNLREEPRSFEDQIKGCQQWESIK